MFVFVRVCVCVCVCLCVSNIRTFTLSVVVFVYWCNYWNNCMFIVIIILTITGFIIHFATV